MPPSCLVKGCSFSYRKDKDTGVKLVSFAKRKESRKLKWIQLCGYNDDAKLPPAKLNICSKHFEPEDHTVKSRLGFVGKTGRFLSDDIDPSIDLPILEPINDDNCMLIEDDVATTSTTNIISNYRKQLEEMKKKIQVLEQENDQLNVKLANIHTNTNAKVEKTVRNLLGRVFTPAQESDIAVMEFKVKTEISEFCDEDTFVDNSEKFTVLEPIDIKIFPSTIKTENGDDNVIIKVETNEVDIKLEKLTTEELDIKNEDDVIDNAGGKKYECTICSYKSDYKTNWQKHMKTHTSKKTYECKICRTTYSTKNLFIRHKKFHAIKKSFKCSSCDVKFIDNSELEKHKKTHANEKSLECDVSQMKFNDRKCMVGHKRLHTGEKRFECDICQKRFSRKSYLKVHIFSHMGKKPFECDECHSRFRTKGNLNRHKLVHTGEKPYECQICYMRVSEKSSLNSHMLTHSSEKPFICDICPAKYGSRGGLRNHKRTIHGF